MSASQASRAVVPLMTSEPHTLKLEDALSSELSGNFKSLAKKLTKTPWEVMAKALYEAMQGAGTKERVLIEVLATCSNDDIVELKKAYEKVLEDEGKSKGN
ncbi:unnamed protein product [Dibothriocephalus latus]|uniref:Annexin n=1 Tax=Dibothriocephalus latus TaxID=60516 RepID=A0A3P7RTE5_DIBLA|nr:unnamed protein product [Dibothriocephalus latus]